MTNFNNTIKKQNEWGNLSLLFFYYCFWTSLDINRKSNIKFSIIHCFRPPLPIHDKHPIILIFTVGER